MAKPRQHSIDVGEVDRGSYRYRVVFTVLRPLIKFIMWIIFNYKPIPYHEDPDKSYFILANHTGALDPILVALSFKRPVFFVASDHIFRLGWVSRLLRFLVAPIPIVKSKMDLRAIRTIASELSQGLTVALFPSGSRSLNGSEEPIPPATAKLLKKLKVPVLLYRLEGGYLTSPRWAKHHRRGKMVGSVIMHYTQEDIKNLSLDELRSMLDQFLDANPYLPGRETKIKYKGRKLAESLERVLYVCPSCRELNTLRSKKDILACTCGFRIAYTEEGFFAPVSDSASDKHWVEEYPHIYRLHTWQTEQLPRILNSEWYASLSLTEPIFTDIKETLRETQRASKNKKILSGSIYLFKDRLEYRDTSSSRIFPITDIAELGLIGPQRLQFTQGSTGITFESFNEEARSANKYIDLVRHIQTLTNTKDISDDSNVGNA